MRTLGVAVAVFAAVGCADDGVYIEVVAPEGVTEVELFVVQRECDGSDTQNRACDGLQPADFAEKVGGDIFIRAQDDGESWKVTVDDGSAWFKFGVDRFPLQRVVAVGFTDGEPDQYAVIENVDLSYSHKVVVTLADVDPWTDANEDHEQPALKLWANGRCLGFHDGEESWFIVTEGDADCDEVQGEECDPLVYLASEDRPSFCVTAAPGECVLGTSVCNERMPEPTMGCEPTQVPVDEDLCTACEGKGEGCVVLAFESEFPQVRCTFFYDATATDPEQACDGTNNAPSEVRIQPNDEPYCATDAGVASIGLPPGGFAPIFEQDPDWVRLYIDAIGVPGQESCHVKMYWDYLSDAAPAMVPTDRTLLFQSRLSNLPRDHVMPMFIHFEPGCDGGQLSGCSVVLEDPDL